MYSTIILQSNLLISDGIKLQSIVQRALGTSYSGSPLRAGPQQALLWASFQTYLLLLQFSDKIRVGTSGVASIRPVAKSERTFLVGGLQDIEPLSYKLNKA